jgi:HipA-like protein
MRRAKVYNFNTLAGMLEELEKGKSYKFIYDRNYEGPSISLTMSWDQKEYIFEEFPPFFDGLLPVGKQLESLLRLTKTDRNDHFAHLLIVGGVVLDQFRLRNNISRCPITYELCGDRKYSWNGLKLLSPNLIDLNDFEYTQEELIRESAAKAVKLSIQGVQPKLSARLSVSQNKYEVVDRFGKYILKPQNLLYPELPQNEDLTMRLAEIVDIEIPFH